MSDLKDFSKDGDRFTPEQIETFRKSAKLQLKGEGSCRGISCADCRGHREYNNGVQCTKNGWVKRRWISEPDPHAVESCKIFLIETEEMR
jgi:hypothetical protein